MENERLWRVWWLWGIPMAWAASALVIVAEMARNAGHGRWGDMLDLARLCVYWLWLRLAWKCSRNVRNPLWTPIARGALIAGLIINVLA